MVEQGRGTRCQTRLIYQQRLRCVSSPIAVNFVVLFALVCVVAQASYWTSVSLSHVLDLFHRIPLSRFIAFPYTSCAGDAFIVSLTFVFKIRVTNGIIS